MKKSLSLSFLVFGLLVTCFYCTNAAATEPDPSQNSQCIRNLVHKTMGQQYSVGFANYSSKTKDNYAVIDIFANDSIDPGKPIEYLYGGCSSGGYWGPSCEINAGASITCNYDNSTGTYTLVINSGGGNGTLTIRNKTDIKGTLKIQNGHTVDYGGPFISCTFDDSYCHLDN